MPVTPGNKLEMCSVGVAFLTRGVSKYGVGEGVQVGGTMP